jgi:hypothetical protein
MNGNLIAIGLLVLLTVPGPVRTAAAQDYQAPADLEPLHRPLDQMLDLYVRDGLVYYRALAADRAGLDRYLAALATPAVAAELPSWDKPRQMAFWLNAYDALVLHEVVDHYPIRGSSPGIPANSIRQVPGAFDQRRHQIAGRSLTLDELETTILAGFHDPRVFLVLGRGAVGSGRLRSEAFSGPRLEAQLAEGAEQFAATPKYIRVDELTGSLRVSPILSWRAPEFTAAYAAKAMALPGRTPLELAVVGLSQPYLTAAERDFLARNTFKLAYQNFDWSLNDLTGR